MVSQIAGRAGRNLPACGSFDGPPPTHDYSAVPKSKPTSSRGPGRPPKPPRTAFSVRLPADLYESFSLGAWAQDRVMAEIIEELVRAWVESRTEVIDQARALRKAAIKQDKR